MSEQKITALTPVNIMVASWFVVFCSDIRMFNHLLLYTLETFKMIIFLFSLLVQIFRLKYRLYKYAKNTTQSKHRLNNITDESKE